MPANEYQITQVNEFTMLDEAGNPIAGYRVYFAWGLGRRGHVDIPKDRATQEVRNQLIMTEIERQEDLWG